MTQATKEEIRDFAIASNEVATQIIGEQRQAIRELRGALDLARNTMDRCLNATAQARLIVMLPVIEEIEALLTRTAELVKG